MHSKNLMPFSLSRSSRCLNYLKKVISSLVNLLVLLPIAAALSSKASGVPSAGAFFVVCFLKLLSGILSNFYPYIDIDYVGLELLSVRSVRPFRFMTLSFEALCIESFNPSTVASF